MTSTVEMPNEANFNRERVQEKYQFFDSQPSPTKTVEDEEEDDDAELEELVERSVRRFIGIGASQSAHANLAQMANTTKLTQHTQQSSTFDEVEEESEDSDEEFYVHKALLPFRKSKSTAFGFYHDSTINPKIASLTISSGAMNEENNRKQKRVEMLYANRNAEHIDDGLSEMPLLGTPKLTSLNMIWPEPDQDFRRQKEESDHPVVNLKRGDVLTVRDDNIGDKSEVCATESCWSAPTHLLSPSPSTSSSVSSNLFGDSDSELGDKHSDLNSRRRVERLSRSWSAPSSLFEQQDYEIENDDGENFSIRPLHSHSSKICRSFSTDFLLDKKRNQRHHRMWSRSCYALSAADEHEELDYVSSEVNSMYDDEEEENSTSDKHSLIDEEEDSIADEQEEHENMELSDERMSLSEDAEQMSISDHEQLESDIDEAGDQLEENLTEFSTRRRSQLYIHHHQMPQSKSDGHLLSSAVPPQKRPRTPCFDESRNSLNTIQHEHMAPFIKHSATYSGQVAMPQVKMSSGRSFIERLKERQRLKEESKKKKVERVISRELPDDLVESFDIDCRQELNINEQENWLNPHEELNVNEDNSNAISGYDSIHVDLLESTEDETKEMSESVNPRYGLLVDEIPDRPDSLPDHWKTVQDERLLKASPNVEWTNNVLSPLVAPQEYQADLCETTPGSNGSDEMMSARSAYLYSATTAACTNDLDNEDDIPMADDDSLVPQSLTEIIQQSRFKVKPALRRRSPPIASEDELSDSEISELERQLANRQPSIDALDQEEGMPNQISQIPEVEHYYCRHPRNFPKLLPGSASMPSFVIPLTRHPNLLNNMKRDEQAQLEETVKWLRKSKTQQFDQLNEDGQQETNLTQSGFLSGSRRRLPMRPDDINGQVRPFQKAIVQSIQQQSVQDKPYFSRRLPTLPQSPASESPTFPLRQMSATLAANTSPPTSANQNANSNSYSMQSGRPSNEQMVHPLLMKHTNPPAPGNLPPRGTIASQLGHTHDYQLSYGIESSLVRSTTNYGLEDSYYEDGLNGNATHFSQRKVINAYGNQEDSSGISSLASDPTNSGPTHRAQFTFVPRHDDEILLEIGDPLKVEREYEDHWCFGTNLRTGHQGLFPSAHLFPVDPIDEITSNILPANIKPQSERDTFYLTLLASIEVAHHKGNDVLVQAINKVCELYQSKEEILVPQTVLMEISFRGIHVIDKMKKDIFRCPTFDYFYSLQNISFCGAHPKQLRYFGFITKHPLLPRFACHVFLSNESTQTIVESIGRAFKRSYDEYMAFAHPTEDIYIE